MPGRASIPLLVLIVVACRAGGHEREAGRAAAEVPRDAGERRREVGLTLEDRGRPPYRRLLAPIGPGQRLAVRIANQGSNTFGPTGSDPSTWVERPSKLEAIVELVARPAPDRRLDFELREVSGVRDNTLPRTGTIVLGGWEEPTTVILAPSGTTPARPDAAIAWQQTVVSMMRTLLPPVPTEPVGAGARWTWTTTDAPGAGIAVRGVQRFEVATIDDEHVTIFVTGQQSSEAAGASGTSETRGNVTFTVKRRALPTLEIRTTGEMKIGSDTGLSTNVTTVIPLESTTAVPAPN